MGTRHNVVFVYNEDEIKILKNGKVSFANFKSKVPMVYVHWDGYPSGALPVLVEYLNSEGAKRRLHDPEYLSAWYIAWKIIYDFEKIPKDCPDYTGIGIETQCNDWCDFTYIVCREIIYILSYDGTILYKFHYQEEDLDDIKQEEWYY